MPSWAALAGQPWVPGDYLASSVDFKAAVWEGNSQKSLDFSLLLSLPFLCYWQLWELRSEVGFGSHPSQFF